MSRPKRLPQPAREDLVLVDLGPVDLARQLLAVLVLVPAVRKDGANRVV